ncbi:MAG: branched-chain amino acid ABC transporter permease [Anaerolineae bacterium]
MESIIIQLPQQLVNGFTLGGVYALIALGYSMVYGVLEFLNFAHGEVYMIGAFIGWGVFSILAPGKELLLPAPLIIVLMLLAAMLSCGFLGMVIEWFAYRPLRQAPRLVSLISALGVSFFLQNSVLLTITARYETYRTGLLIPRTWRLSLGNATISFTRMLVIAVAVLLMLALHYLVQKTKLGKAMRATAQDREAAAMMGIDTDRIIVATFFIGSALGGAAGVLVGLLFTQIYHFMGFTAGLKGFTAAVLGGIGSIPGAMLGGLLLGLIESIGTGFISPTYKDLIVFGLLIILLLFRPMGLLGARAMEKV